MASKNTSRNTKKELKRSGENAQKEKKNITVLRRKKMDRNCRYMQQLCQNEASGQE